MTRLLNTPIIGPKAAIVDSSWIDVLAGLVPSGIRRTPPGFWAGAGTAAREAANSAAVASAARKLGFTFLFSSPVALAHKLLVEPDVFHPVAVVDAVDHGYEPLDIGLRAGPAARIKDDRPSLVLGEFPFNLPHQLLALFPVGLGRLLIDQLVDLRIAIAGVVAHRPAHEVFVELLVWVVDAALGAIDRDRVVLAVDLGEPVRGLDRFERGVDVDLP